VRNFYIRCEFALPRFFLNSFGSKRQTSAYLDFARHSPRHANCDGICAGLGRRIDHLSPPDLCRISKNEAGVGFRLAVKGAYTGAHTISQRGLEQSSRRDVAVDITSRSSSWNELDFEHKDLASCAQYHTFRLFVVSTVSNPRYPYPPCGPCYPWRHHRHTPSTRYVQQLPSAEYFQVFGTGKSLRFSWRAGVNVINCNYNEIKNSFSLCPRRENSCVWSLSTRETDKLLPHPPPQSWWQILAGSTPRLRPDCRTEAPQARCSLTFLCTSVGKCNAKGTWL